MKKIRSVLLAGLLIPCWGGVRAQPAVSVIKSYLDAMKQLSSNCSMAYKATCIYPDKSQTNVTGRLAISASNYYDSSNIRFVLMNKDWLVMAEHQQQLLNIIYLPEWKKKMGKDFELDISGYLLSNANLEDFSAFKINPVGKDSFNVRVNYNLGGGQLIDLLLHYSKGAIIPASYEGTITYSMTDPEDEPVAMEKQETVRVQFECHNISQTIDPELFSDSRLITVTKGKAQMKRYNNYKIYRKMS